MIDIVGISTDLELYDAQTAKAANVLSVQIGKLEYAKTFGIDLEFFLNPNFQFQNESFNAYLIQRLAENHVNVNQVIETLTALMDKLTIVVGDAQKNAEGFIR